MNKHPAPHTWMHRNHHPSSKCTNILPLTHECTANRDSSGRCTGILPLTHECTEIIIPRVNAPESYPSHINAPKSSLQRSMHTNLTTHTWMHWNHPPSSKCTGILPLTHECTANRHSSDKCIIILPFTHECTANHHLSSKCIVILPLTHECTANCHPSGKCNNILPLTHECTEIIIPQVNAPESCPSHMNASQSSLPR